MHHPAPRPVVGAALGLPMLQLHRDWILEHQRDLEVQDFFASDVLDGDWRPLADQIRSALDGYSGRLGIHGPFWGFKIDSHDADIRAVVRKRLMQGLDVCAVLGATQMVIHSPYTTWDHNNLDMYSAARAGVVERVHATLRDVVLRAEDMGCELVIENIEDKDPVIRVDLARSFGSKAVKVSIDTGHAHYAHVSTGAPPVDFYVTAAGAELHHVHIQDTEGYADRHWLPGEGTIRWEGVFRALSELSVSPRLIMEARNQRELMKGFRHLVDLGLVD
jgi:sugar phosphate isomerase/epimerase